MTGLAQARAGALARWQQLGWPTTRDEAWRNFSTKPLQELPLTGGIESGAPLSEVFVASLPTPRVVFVDGRYVASMAQDVAGVSVTLLDPDGNRAYDADGDPVPTTVTDADGFYVFDNLLPGDYRVSFRNLPDGFTFTTTGSGGASDSNPPASGLTPVFTISPTDRDTRAVTSADPVTVASLINPTIDAGIIDPTVDGLIPVPGTATTTTVAPTTTAVGGDSNLPAAGADSIPVGFAALLVSIAGVGLVLASRRRPAAR